MQLTDMLIFGHTHRPYIDIENRVVNTGAWTADMLIPKWFEEYGQDKAYSGWFVEISNGEYKQVLYGIRPKTKEERKNSESNQEDQKENVVSKAASQEGDAVKQMVEAGTSVIMPLHDSEDKS